MTREEKIEMFAMRVDGATLQEIGDRFGVTRERVRQILDAGCSSVRTRDGKFSDIIYKGLREWAYKNVRSRTEFVHMISPDADCNKVFRFWGRLNGKLELQIGEIKAILNATGMTFEEAFAEEREPT